MTVDKKDNYLNGYCTGQTDLLQEMKDHAPTAYMYDQARYGPTDLRGQQWLPAISRLKPYEGNGMVRGLVRLYTHLQQRPWVGLTDEDKDEIIRVTESDHYHDIFMLAEAKLKEKNT